jgi:hypothetical protein
LTYAAKCDNIRDILFVLPTIKETMSTSITGYLVNEGTDPFELSRRTREVFLPILRKQIYTEFLQELVKAYDKATFSPETRKIVLADMKLEEGDKITYGKLTRKAKDIQQKHMEEIPDLYEVKLGFLKDPETGQLLCAWFGSRDNKEIFDEFDGVTEFSYWNSTEGPDDISEEDWEERGEIWNRSFLPSGHVKSSTLMSQVASPGELSLYAGFEEMEAAGATLPSRKFRVRNLVEQFISKEWFEETEDPTANFSGLMRALRDEERVSRWTKFVEEGLAEEPLTVEQFRKGTWEDQEVK